MNLSRAYAKNMLHEVGVGFDLRTIPQPVSILIHTTNGRVGTRFEDEAKYLRDSRTVSAHYLVGKQGRVEEILHPIRYRAWHAGYVSPIRFNNDNSVGIENHWTPLEGNIWPTAMRDALTELVEELINGLHITDKTAIETHRKVAIRPVGRKIDPSGWNDHDFYEWRERLFIPKGTNEKLMEVALPEGVAALVRQGPSRSYDISGRLYRGDRFYAGDIKRDENGAIISGRNEWVHIKSGMKDGKPIDGLGFVHISSVITVG